MGACHLSDRMENHQKPKREKESESRVNRLFFLEKGQIDLKAQP
ncbi:hypothetical protein CHCC14820_0579 [Bacillus paralicheniformis]|jgi:hypothetical protein|uniref:Uncharacterized protein n=1 Tax=Bacillus paralicheniformis TaxID=1648923 RepID=A0A6I7TPM9_9BACI|nr:hypothetical protein SC10_B2orf06174 [Bacillus paralicheniformis]OLF95876.1 hypothetical protein B4121_1438 [Bacillus paralicheniformis]OLG05144.1 hypothetical protein B4125_3216 [Bacillus paralicheniformis]OLG12886.1 hypothetical protein B4123_0615 [Bacillus paralicheniformis]TWJ38304.1 hypothetical protein CHCC5027_1067 [Bacillus paralicheniformis]